MKLFLNQITTIKKNMRTQLTDLKKELQQIQATLIHLKSKGSLTERIKKRLENRELYIKSIIFNIQ